MTEHADPRVPDREQAIREAARRLDEKADQLAKGEDRVIPLPDESDDDGAGEVGGLVP